MFDGRYTPHSGPLKLFSGHICINYTSKKTIRIVVSTAYLYKLFQPFGGVRKHTQTRDRRINHSPGARGTLP